MRLTGQSAGPQRSSLATNITSSRDSPMTAVWQPYSSAFAEHCRAAHLIGKVAQGSLQPLRRVQQLDEGWLVPAMALVAPQFWNLADLV